MFFFALCIISVFSEFTLPPLSNIQIVYSTNTEYYYVFSGRISPQKFSPSMKILSDYLRFKFSSALFYPEDRSMYGMVIDPTGLVIYIYGGLGLKGVYGDLWMYFVNNDTFQEIVLTGSHVPNRYNMQFLYYTYNEEDNIALLGGLDSENKILSDFYM